MDEGLSYLVSKVHKYPNQPLIRQVLADYLLENFSHLRKYHEATSQIVLSVLSLGLTDRRNIQTASGAAKAMLKASVALKPLDVKRSSLYIQRASLLDPTCKEALQMLKYVERE